MMFWQCCCCLGTQVLFAVKVLQGEASYILSVEDSNFCFLRSRVLRPASKYAALQEAKGPVLKARFSDSFEIHLIRSPLPLTP